MRSTRHDETDIPTAKRVSELIRELDQDEIVQMFTAINRRFIRLVSDLGFLQDEKDIALDTTWITWGGDGDGDDSDLALINNPQIDQGWCFGALCFMDRKARFALGIDLISDKGEYADHFWNLLRTVGQEGEIGRIYADREFERGKVVKMCRANVRDHWAVRVRANKDKGEVAEVIANTEEGESNFVEKVAFADLNIKPNVYVHPIPERHQSDGGDTKMVFLTDMDKDDIDDANVYDRYSKRWTIETFFRQLKHRYCPSSKSPSPELRLFPLNTGLLFYNFHTLMTRAPSPHYCLRLDIAYHQVLQGIVNTVFTRTGATDL